MRDQWRPTLASVVAVTLTSFSLAPTLEGGPWFKACLFMILLVAGSGMALRAASLPGVLVVATQGLAVVIALIWMFGLGGAAAGPNTLASVWHELSALASEGWAVIQREATPITATDGVRLLVVSGVAFIALLVDAIAVTGRRATLAGIPLLFLYLVPATVLPDGVPWPLFLTAGIGWIVLLLADGWQQLSRWGRPLRDTDTRLHSIGGTGRRLGATALAVAVVVPVILPSLDDGRFGGNDTGTGPGVGQGIGVDEVSKVNPIVDIKRNLAQEDDVEVFTYTTDAGTPSYFRIATLDRFTDQKWEPTINALHPDVPATGDVPQPPGLSSGVATNTTSYSINVDNLDSPRLPLPYPVQSIDVEGDWRVDTETLDVFSHVDNANGADYRVSALDVEPTADQLRAAPPPSNEGIINSYLPVDNQVKQLVLPIAEAVTHKATTQYDQALLLQNWFRTEFTYSLDRAAGNSESALRNFLRDRSGYCEQFAATMALMARSLGIPSRVQVGFTPGERDGDHWVVTLHDAHAWPELWFEGIGWVRFEPTPGGGDGGQTPEWATTNPFTQPKGNNNPGTKTSDPILRKGHLNPGSPRQLPQAAQRGSRGAIGGNTTGTPADSTAGRWWLLAIVVAGVVVAVSPMTAAALRRRRRWAQVETSVAAVRAGWRDVLQMATDVDLAPELTETPRDLAARLPRRGGLSAEQGEKLRQLAMWNERIRYAAGSTPLPEAAEIRGIADDIREGLLAALSTRDRRRARWWPRSGRAALAEAGTAIGDRLGDLSSGVGDWLRGISGRRRGAAPNALRSGS